MIQIVDSLFITIDTDDFVTHFSKAGGGYQADITCPNNG